MPLTDDIRSGCAHVATRARSVRIDEARIASYASSLPLATLEKPHLDAKTHFIGAPRETATYFLAVDTINFGSGWWPVFRKRAGMSGYYTVASCLADEFRRAGAISAEQLAELSQRDCTRIFEQDSNSAPVMELMQHFARALNDFGRLIIEHFDGDVMQLIASAEHSAERLAEVLAQMPYFQDVSRYDDLDVPLYKRAQLAPADLSIALAGHPLARFDDRHRLTIFADNLVPHVLRIDGILRYDAELAARIDREELIEPGSKEEIELRACAVHACEMIVRESNRAGRPVTAMQLDYLLWHRGGERSYKQAAPRHRARSIFY